METKTMEPYDVLTIRMVNDRYRVFNSWGDDVSGGVPFKTSDAAFAFARAVAPDADYEFEDVHE